MDINNLIDELDNLVQRARRVPGNKVLLDEAAVRQILDEMRAALNDELRLSQRTNSERERILNEARAQAQRIIESGRTEAASRVDDQGIVQAARERARTIVAEAEQKAAQLQKQADQYTAMQLANLESRLHRVLREVQAGQRYLASGGEEQPRKETK